MDPIKITFPTPDIVKKLPGWIKSWFKIKDTVTITIGWSGIKDILTQIAKQVPQPLRGLLEAAIASM